MLVMVQPSQTSSACGGHRKVVGLLTGFRYIRLVYRRLIFAALLVCLVPAIAADAYQTPGFDFQGSGWGHGVGMGQWGARGQALTDPTKSGEDIAAHYFPGSEPASLGDLSLPNDLLQTLDKPLWVNLGSQVTLLEFTAVGGRLDLCLAGDGEGPCPKPQHPQAGERWEFRRIAPGRCGFFHGGQLQGTPGDCRAAISWPDAKGVRLRHGEDRSKLCLSRASEECEYRHGELKMRDDPVETGFHVVLAVGLEDYVRGVAELPDDWTEAGVNQAQAVTARSYAAFKFFLWETRARPTNPDEDPGISDARKDSCWCHLYDNWRDINYIGWTKEARSASQPWLSGVETTRDRLLTYFGDDWENVTKGGIVQTFFSASSGGITRSNVYGFRTVRDGQTSAREWPYLRPVADPWDLDPAVGNPHASWEERVSAATVARWLGWDEVTEAVLVARASLSSPTQVLFRGVRNGQAVSVTISGDGLRTGLGLKSSNITAIDGVAPVDPTPSDGNGEEELFEPDAFEDDAGDIHEPSINHLAEMGVLDRTECGERRICPDEPLLRWVMAVWMIRILDQVPDSQDALTRFEDVEPHTWWAPYVERMAEISVTKGCNTDPLQYCPDQPVTRAQMASFLARALSLPPAPSAGFTDTLGNTHQANIDALAAAGVTKGCANDPARYCPERPVTRAEMATFLSRALEKFDLTPGSEPVRFDSSFEVDSEGWEVGFADLPADYNPSIYELDSGHGALPDGLEGAGIYIQGHNRSDDLFMYLKRRVDGLVPMASYEVAVTVELATNVAVGLIGIGGSPGESVFVKAGASTVEPAILIDGSGYFRMNIDKGNQARSGTQMVVIGDVAHPDVLDNEYRIKTLDNSGAPVTVEADRAGSAWLIVGTDSGFEGLTHLYYPRIIYTLTLVEPE